MVKMVCQKAGDQLLANFAVKEAGYNLDQAIDAVYTYLEFLGKEEEIKDGVMVTIPSIRDKNNAIILNPDFSFNIPLIKYKDPNGFEHYYNVDFSFTPSGNRILFEPVKITEIQ